MFQNRLKTQSFLMLLCFTLLFQVSAWSNETTHRPFNSYENTFVQSAEEGVPIVDILLGVHGSVYMSWTPFESSGEYSVTVTDLTAFVVIASFTTNNTTATVNGHISGHTYRYMVTDGVDFIIEDVVH